MNTGRRILVMAALAGALAGGSAAAMDVNPSTGRPAILLSELDQPTPLVATPTASSHEVMQIGLMPAIQSEPTTWVLVAPYVWATAMEGNVGAAGTTTGVNVSLADLVDLIPDLNGAFMGHVEVGRGRAGLIFDGLLMQLSPSDTGPLGSRVTLDVGATILESLGMVRLIDLHTDVTSDSRFAVDLLGGARYYQVQTGIHINPVIGPTVQAELTKDWVDLVIGARSALTVAPGLDAFVRGDVGGFGWGTSSDLAWNVTSGIEYACPAWPGSSVLLGYRALSIDETQGSGADRFLFDVTLHGPFCAVAFRF